MEYSRQGRAITKRPIHSRCVARCGIVIERRIENGKDLWPEPIVQNKTGPIREKSEENWDCSLLL